MADKVLIWCLERNMYWKANNVGYTQELSEAGLYHRQKAESICRNANAHGKEEERIIELSEAFESLQLQYRINKLCKASNSVKIPAFKFGKTVKFSADDIKAMRKINPEQQTCWECGAEFMGFRDECLNCLRGLRTNSRV